MSKKPDYLFAGAYGKPFAIPSHELKDDPGKMIQIGGYMVNPRVLEYKGWTIPAIPSAEERMDDELYTKAVRIVYDTQKCRLSTLQQRLNINYARASGLIERMIEDGIVKRGANGVPVFCEMEMKRYLQELGVER